MRRLSAALALWAVCAGTALADVITAKNGQRLEGLITRETEQSISINVDGLELTMGRDEIAKVEKKPLPKKPKPAPPKKEEPKPAPPASEPAVDPASAAALATPPETGPAAAASEFPILVFDERNWKMGHQSTAADALQAEFVLENETVQNWSELVTAQMFPGLQSKSMPADFAYSAKREITQVCPTADWRLLGASQSEATYEWSIQGCQAQPDQMEIVRVVRGDLGMHLIHYAVKKSRIPDEERMKWIERLARARLVKKN